MCMLEVIIRIMQKRYFKEHDINIEFAAEDAELLKKLYRRFFYPLAIT